MELLFIILIVVSAARIAGELMERMELPSLVGELLAGLVLGLVVIVVPWRGINILDITQDAFFIGLVDVAIFMLMFLGGLEVSLRNVARASRVGVPVAMGGVLVPLSLGIVIGLWFIPESEYRLAQILFLGVALSITAIPVSVRALIDLNQLHSRAGSAIINAAVLDDITGVVLLAILTTILESGAVPSVIEIGAILGKLVIFLAASYLISRYVVPRLDRFLPSLKADELHLSLGIVFGLAMAILAELLGMHFIIGAFIGGLLFSRGVSRSTEQLDDMEEKLRGITLGFLAPIFFVSIGLHIDLSAFGQALWFTLTLLAAAVAGKIGGAGLAARLVRVPWKESLAIGVGMNGRGAVELIVASVALEAGLFSLPDPPPPVVTAVFSAVVIVTLLTTLMTPIGLRLLLPRQKSEAGERDEPVAEP